MKDLLVSLAAGIFLGAALFDAMPHSAALFGWQETIVLTLLGVGLWWLSKVIVEALKKPAMPPLVVTALWLHSAVEGFVTGIAFGISNTVGFVVLTGMVLHLLPEFFAAITLLRDTGTKTKTSVIITFVGYAVLFSAFFLTVENIFTMRIFMPTLIAISAGAFLFIGVNVLRKRFVLSNVLAATLGAGITFFLS